MNRQDIITELTREINRLTSARTLLEDKPQTTTTNGSNSVTNTTHTGIRKLSPAARKKISEAAKARWARQKAAA